MYGHCTCFIKSYSSSRLTYKTLKTLDIKTFITAKLHASSIKKKILFSTLVSYDANYVPRALDSGEGIRGSILILILNIFRYMTHDPVVQTIHLNSYTLVQLKSNNYQAFSPTGNTSTINVNNIVLFRPNIILFEYPCTLLV